MRRPGIVIHAGPKSRAWWVEHLQSLLPEFACSSMAGTVDAAAIAAAEYAVVWRPPTGEIARFPNLRAIVSIGAGVDHITADAELPPAVPIIRTTGEDLAQRMREYVALHVLRLHRRLAETELAQTREAWFQQVNPPAPHRRVGVMGLGNLGAQCARTLSAIGFDVRGWSRRGQALQGAEGVAVFGGDEALPAFLAGTDILVCLLPLTPATAGILNRATFDLLPKGASIINAARGEHLVEADLLAAMDAGQIGAATLDVFHTEPLPAGHPFWAHPRVLVTPHVASMIDPESGGRLIADNIRRFHAGEPVADLVDLERGY